MKGVRCRIGGLEKEGIECLDLFAPFSCVGHTDTKELYGELMVLVRVWTENPPDLRARAIRSDEKSSCFRTPIVKDCCDGFLVAFLNSNK